MFIFCGVWCILVYLNGGLKEFFLFLIFFMVSLEDLVKVFEVRR